MNKAANQFREIVAKGADFTDCEYRVGGGMQSHNNRGVQGKMPFHFSSTIQTIQREGSRC